MNKDVNTFSAYAFNQKDHDFVTFPFFYDGKEAFRSFTPADVPTCMLSLAAAGSLRYNSGNMNPARESFFGRHIPGSLEVVPLYLIHSKTVYEAVRDGVPEEQGRTVLVSPDGSRTVPGSEGDGIVTSDRRLVPCVTAADCMPVYLWDSASGAFGLCHSGWKGTGIAVEAVKRMVRLYGTRPKDVCAVLGPHIHSCCYTVDKERAEYFRREFSPSCVEAVYSDHGETWRLSLAEANIVSLISAGIPAGNILHISDCTSCFSIPSEKTADSSVEKIHPYGSFRRQTAHIPADAPLEERFKVFSAMAACTGYFPVG